MAVSRTPEEPARPLATAGLIDSESAEGRVVYDAKGDRIGEITRLMIDKVSGLVTHAMVEGKDGPVSWSSLTFDARRGGYLLRPKAN